jgi:replication factor A2
MALWDQGGSSGFQQRKIVNDGDAANGQRSTVKGVLTCTIATILNAKHSESDNCFVNKHLKFNTVMIMGLIREENHEVNGSLATYNIDDHSGGLLEIKWWHDDSGEPLKPLTYIKVIGQVKIFAGKTHVVAHRVSQMQSLNELIAHSIECVYASLLIRKQEETNGTSDNNHHVSTGNGHQTQQTSTISNGFTPVQNAVLNVLKIVTTVVGLSVTEICKQLKQYSENQVKQALEFLSGEGHIFSTTDDNHYRAASSN